MNRTLVVLVGVLLAVSLCTASHAGLFVATAKNLRGALYQGIGPTPGHATEQAIIKCSQDSFIPPSCKVVCVRMEAPPCPLPPPRPMRKPVKVHKGFPHYPRGYSWGARP
jgi:hypothetical protein